MILNDNDLKDFFQLRWVKRSGEDENFNLSHASSSLLFDSTRRVVERSTSMYIHAITCKHKSRLENICQWKTF